MREPLGWVALVSGAVVAAEGVRTLVVFARHRDAKGKAYLGTMLALFGVSLAFRAPQSTEATGLPDLPTFVRGACSLGTVVGPVGLLGLSGWRCLRPRYALAVVVVGVGVLAWLVYGESGSRGRAELLGSVVWISGAVPGLVYAVFMMRIARIVRQASRRIRAAGSLTIAGCAVCVTGVVASVITVVGGPDFAGGSACQGLLVQGMGGLLIAAGSCYGEAASLFAAVRRRLEDLRVRRLWHYVEPIRRTMADRLYAGGEPGREFIDIYDALLVARQQNCGQVRERARLVADAAGLVQHDRDEFVDAVELRAAVTKPCPPSVAGIRAPLTKLDIEVETDPLDVDVATQRAQVARLARLVLRDGMVRRTA